MFRGILGFLTLLLVLILATHAWAFVNSAYYTIWWLDNVLHFAGGFWAATFAFWFLLRHKNLASQIPRWVYAIGFISFGVLVGVFWEFFEFGFDALVANRYTLDPAQLGLADTMSDLFFDFLGAFAASVYFVYFLRKQINETV